MRRLTHGSVLFSYSGSEGSIKSFADLHDYQVSVKKDVTMPRWLSVHLQNIRRGISRHRCYSSTYSYYQPNPAHTNKKSNTETPTHPPVIYLTDS